MPNVLYGAPPGTKVPTAYKILSLEKHVYIFVFTGVSTYVRSRYIVSSQLELISSQALIDCWRLCVRSALNLTQVRWVARPVNSSFVGSHLRCFGLSIRRVVPCRRCCSCLAPLTYFLRGVILAKDMSSGPTSAEIMSGLMIGGLVSSHSASCTHLKHATARRRKE